MKNCSAFNPTGMYYIKPFSPKDDVYDEGLRFILKPEFCLKPKINLNCTLKKCIPTKEYLHEETCVIDVMHINVNYCGGVNTCWTAMFNSINTPGKCSLYELPQDIRQQFDCINFDEVMKFNLLQEQ